MASQPIQLSSEKSLEQLQWKSVSSDWSFLLGGYKKYQWFFNQDKTFLWNIETAPQDCKLSAKGILASHPTNGLHQLVYFLAIFNKARTTIRAVFDLNNILIFTFSYIMDSLLGCSTKKHLSREAILHIYIFVCESKCHPFTHQSFGLSLCSLRTEAPLSNKGNTVLSYHIRIHQKIFLLIKQQKPIERWIWNDLRRCFYLSDINRHIREGLFHSPNAL